MVQPSTSVTLRPSRAAVGQWTLVGAIASGLAVWVAIDARTSLIAWLFVGLCLLATTYVAIQLVLPSRFRLVLDDAGIEVVLPWQRTRLTWERVHLARVVPVTGEQVLELHVWDPDDESQSTPRALGILLPFGADLAVLHRVLEQRLGRHEPASSRDRQPT